MRLYCLTCREYIMNTSPEFILGGPYHGAMFEGATGDYWSATMFRMVESVKGGDLFCPRCTGRFFGPTGGLLTEYGEIQAGQKSIDTTFNIVHQDGPAKGQLMYIKDSIIPKDPDHEAALDEAIKKSLIDPRVPPGMLDKVVSSDEVPVGQVLFVKDENIVIKEKPEDDLICPKCGKEYKDRMWFDKHVEKCEE